MTDPDSPPPILRTWPRLYAFVLFFLLLVICSLYAFMRFFS